mmetsp:Transcript_2333/g.6440  ORF Transcript_2333/g.6440 Transcript_2333/m.6440 type:complete len:127 (+) Transcript_2333:43-423(+)
MAMTTMATMAMVAILHGSGVATPLALSLSPSTHPPAFTYECDATGEQGDATDHRLTQRRQHLQQRPYPHQIRTILLIRASKSAIASHRIATPGTVKFQLLNQYHKYIHTYQLAQVLVLHTHSLHKR